MEERFPWSLRDLVVAALLGAVIGFSWLGWTWLYELAKGPLKALHPGLKYLMVGFWFAGGTLIPFLIRRPGAALLGELLAAAVQGLITPWGWTSLLWGFVQGLGCEAVFFSFRYRRWTPGVFLLAGAVAGVFSWLLDFVWDNYAALGPDIWIIQLGAVAVSGALFGGLLPFLLGKSLVKAGIKAR